MTYFKLDALIVTEENDPVGIITINDIDRRVLSVELDPHLVCVSEAFSEPLLWVRYNTTLSEVAQIMDEKKISRLPIFGNLSSGPILLGIYVHGPSEIELEN
jgi:CBS domain-containing protein